MPLYFAYGANLERPGMRERCPGARPLGAAWLAGHRFFIMASGFASVEPLAGAVVHGLLWDLAAADLPALDAFEEVEAGLYDRTRASVGTPAGAVEAMLYRGASSARGAPAPGYMEAVLAAAAAAGLPASYLEDLKGWLPAG